MEYRNLDLEVFDYRVADDGERFRVRVADSPVEGQRYADTEEVTLPPDLRRDIPSLVQALLSRADMIAVGEKLAALLFPPRAREFLTRSRERLSEEEALRIRLRMHVYALADLPWEYAYIAPPGTPPDQKGLDGFLALDPGLSLVRDEVMGQAPVRLDPIGDGPLRLVALLASPIDTDLGELDLDEEKRRIEAALQGVPAIRPEFHLNATVEALMDALVRGAHVLHFFGHGVFRGKEEAEVGSQGGMGYLILVDERRQIRRLSAEDLALYVRGRGVRLAVLSACEGGRRDTVNAWTGVAPALVRAGVPAVVGMQYPVKAASAVAFSQRLYRELAAGQSIDAAVTAGRLAIRSDSREYGCDWGIPVLYLRADEGVLFPRTAIGRPAGRGQETRPREVTVDRGRVQVDKRVLRTVLVESFALEEVEALCADVQEALADDGISLQVNLEMVGGSGKTGKILSLIGYLDRRGYLGYLVEAMRQERPDVI